MLFDAAFNMDSVSSAGTNNQPGGGDVHEGSRRRRGVHERGKEFRGVPYEYRAKFDAAIHRWRPVLVGRGSA
jgi:hypothetical protein